jgi:TonB family protein
MLIFKRETNYKYYILKLNNELDKMMHTNKARLAILLVGLICSFGFRPLAISGNDKSIQQSKKKSTEQVSGKFNSVKINEQTWMTENLNVDHYRNGDKIPQVKDPEKWAKLTTGAWCYYNNDSQNSKKYGKLYNWYAVNDPRGLAPYGWHIPTKEEFEALEATVIRDGNKLKAIGQGIGVGSGKNTTGFTALMAGVRDIDGSFVDLYSVTNFWSSVQVFIQAHSLGLHFDNSSTYSLYFRENCGFSVRCVKDIFSSPQNNTLNVETTKVKGAPDINSIVHVDKQPQVVVQVPPVYPDLAKRAGVEGTVYVKILVGKEGRPLKAIIMKSDNVVFNQSSIDAALKFVFTPAIKDKSPIMVWVVVPFKFRLNE